MQHTCFEIPQPASICLDKIPVKNRGLELPKHGMRPRTSQTRNERESADHNMTRLHVNKIRTVPESGCPCRGPIAHGTSCPFGLIRYLRRKRDPILCEDAPNSKVPFGLCLRPVRYLIHRGFLCTSVANIYSSTP